MSATDEQDAEEIPPTPPVVIHLDEHFVVVDKPSGLAVHRSQMVPDRVTALSLVRDTIGMRVYPVHRIDRGTSGLLLFALDSETAAALQRSFIAHAVEKTYLAIVRGWFTEDAQSGEVDHSIPDRHDRLRLEAHTRYTTLDRVELQYAVGPYTTARYSLMQLQPLTGRTHQLRRHMTKVDHPILGDTLHGDSHHNRFLRHTIGIPRLMLHAWHIRFPHPFSGESLGFTAPIPNDMMMAMLWMGLNLPIPSSTIDI